MAPTGPSLSCAAIALSLALGSTSAGSGNLAPGLALACTGCHSEQPADDKLQSISSLTASEIVTAMREFRSGQRSATLMDRIAKGFSDEEIQTIAEWFGSQK